MLSDRHSASDMSKDHILRFHINLQLRNFLQKVCPKYFMTKEISKGKCKTKFTALYQVCVLL
jgi:hypothetical protein